MQQTVGNRAVQRYLRVEKESYTIADLRTRKNEPRMKSLNAALNPKPKQEKRKGADAMFALLKDPDITFVFKDDSAFEAYLDNPSPAHYTMEMKFDPKKACIAQALELAGTGKSAQKWHAEFLAQKINYTEDGPEDIRKALGYAGFKQAPGIAGVIEEVLPELSPGSTYILIGGSTAELHAVIYRNGKVQDTQGVNTKGVQIDIVYQQG